ncbi:translocation/assembly module TamB [Hymenobacter aerilatus]|uniref:Translocation/assembly module TamB n=1 Tax=Hymenobacter aerilatus TaxID=2932251 RepID=A0A8T9SYF8_9BACT|nr:translocation/assembly module TamB domain-containing protein [Hymenobacter aerilatus]UOR05763.1 translocation/assembly module TamB [Hymenobacter aerilatus]
MPRFLFITLKALLGLVGLVLLLVVGLLIALRIPTVQTRLVQRAATVLTEKLGQPVRIDRVDIRPFSRVLLEGVQVLDRRGNELFNIGRADADISLFSVFDPSHLHVGKLTLEEPRFALITYANQPDSTNLSQFLSAVRRLVGPSDTTKVSKPFDFQIESIGLRNGRFILDRRDVPRAPTYGQAVDYAHMRVDSIYADFSNIRLVGDTVAARIQGLRTTESNSDTRVRELSAAMIYAPKFWEFADLMLRVQNSRISNYVRFDYNHFLNFADFNDSVQVTARLQPSRLYSDDIAKFAPQIEDLNETVLISGQAKGYVRRFSTKNLDVRYGRNTHVVGDINVDGLPNFTESFVEARLRNSVVDGRDLRRYIPASGRGYVDRLGAVKLNGQFLGYYNDFVANGSFDTQLGKVVSDVNLKFKTDPRYSSYEGQVKTTDFQLGRLLGDQSVIRDVTLNGRVQGVGFIKEAARVQANATVQRIWLNGYRYRNIAINGNFRQQAFQGKVSVNDPNVKLAANGTVNLRTGAEAFDLRADVDRANLRALGLTSQNVTLATTADVQFQGLRLDELEGRVLLRNSRLGYQGNTVPIDTFDVVSTRQDGQRLTTLRSEVLDLRAKGNFDYTRVIDDVERLVQEYRLNFESNDAAIADYYRRKRLRPTPEYQIDLDLYIKQANPVLQLFMPQLTVSDYSRVDGSFRNGNTSIFTLGGHFDEIRYDSVRVQDTDFSVTTSKLPNQPEVLAQASITSAQQHLPGLGATENFYVEGVWDQEKINFSTALAQTNTTNRAQINGSLGFLPDAVQVIFRQSGVNLLGKQWTIAADNSVMISNGGKEVDIKNFVFSNGAQSISAQGAISRDPAKELAINVQNFELQTLGDFTDNRLKGRVNMQGTVSGVFNQLALDTELKVDSLRLDNVLLGSVKGKGTWDAPNARMAVNLDVERDNHRVVNVTGTLTPQDVPNQLNLIGVLDEAPVKLAEPILSTLFKDLGGTAVGRLQLTGRLAAPHLVGTLDVADGKLTFIYLGTTYTFSDRITFTDDRIALNNIRLSDPLGNSGTVDGNIYHDGFQNMRLDLRANFRKLQALNTTRRDNDLYFGTAYATGTARVSGPTDDLLVNVSARSEAGTRVFLPFDNAAKAQQANYIRFVNHNIRDTTTVQVATTDTAKVDLSGLRLNMNLDVTPDAYVEILLDESTGDIIRGTASGQLRLNIDTRGDFNMYGQIEIVRGAYNFTLQGLVNKEFIVRPGGTIAWNGDPLQGQMNLTAAYTQRTSVAPLLAGNSSVVPVTAVMNLSGPLLLPQINLNLEFNDIPSSLEGDLAPFLSALRNDEQELNRQVFSLIVFRQLTSPGTLSSVSFRGSDNAFGNSVGQVLSTQLSVLTSQIDPNLEISFNLNGLSAEQLQALQVRLSYSFLNGRLRITREGGFTTNYNNSTISNPTNTAQVQGSLLGDLSLEYYLRPDGKFRARLRYETTPRDYSSIANLQNQQRAGISLLHTEQFNTFRELFARKRVRRRDATRKELNIDDDPRTNIK